MSTKLEISRLGHGGEGRGLGVLREVKSSVPLRGHNWEIGAQGHMIPDSDGEVKFMKGFIIYKVFPYSLLPATLIIPCWGEWAWVTLQ